MRILVATDAWHPQHDGVVRTLRSLAASLHTLGVEMAFLTPDGLPSVALPGLSGFRLSLPDPRKIASRIAAIGPDAIHIATEGPIGLAVRRYCCRRGRPFTTSVHTRCGARVTARRAMPEWLSGPWLRWFHNAGRGTMGATAPLAHELAARGVRNVLRWPRGVDTRLFRPRSDARLGLLRPVFLTVGRLTAEKNLAAFLALDLPGTKVVVGEGPARDALARLCPNAVFLGARHGEDLARAYAAADVLVFPNRCETFGSVLLEALACGTPVAGFPVACIRDTIGSAPVAALDENLRAACLDALVLSRTDCRAFAETVSWEESARCFLGNVQRAALATPTLDPLRRLKPVHDATATERKVVEPMIG